MMVLAWIALAVGGFILNVVVLTLIRPFMRLLGMIPPEKAVPHPRVSGTLGIVMLLLLFYLTSVVEIGSVLLWVWAADVVFVLVVALLGLVNRAKMAS